MAKFIRTKIWEKSPMFIDSDVSLHQGRPDELHLLKDGAIGDKPSFVIVMDVPGCRSKVFGQFSLETIQQCFYELGYTLKEKS